MKHKVVAKLKGTSYTSISFIIEDTKKLQTIIDAIDGLPMLDDRYVTIPGDGCRSIQFENGPLSIVIETNVPIYSQAEVQEFLRLEKEEEARKKALEEAEAKEPVPEQEAV